MTRPGLPPIQIQNSDPRRLPPIPTDRGLRRLVRDPLAYFQAIASQYGDVVCYRPAPETAYLVNHPDFVRHVLVDNNRNYSKDTHINRIFNDVVAEGLLTSEGDTWRKQRRMMQPAFHHRRLAPLDELISRETSSMIRRWQDQSDHGAVLDIAREMAELTLRVTTQALFGVQLDGAGRDFGEKVNEAVVVMHKPSNPRFQQLLHEGKEIVAHIIRQRRENFRDSGDLLSSMMVSCDRETGQAMSDEQLQDQVLTLMLAGYETTASALAWTWYLLSQHPEVTQRLREEVCTVLGGRPPAYSDLESLHYTGQVLNEAMRLFPPAWILGRRALGEDEIGGYYVAPGTTIAICLYTLHRHPAFWEQPDRFDPDRFAPEKASGRHRFAFIPFGAGPRQCIGNTFGLMEASLVIAHVAQHYALQLAPGSSVTPQAVFVLRSGRELMMTLHS